MAEKRGRVTIPTDLDVIRETLDIMKEWGADAIRDCDGTEFPQELKDTGSKIYATYYTTRKDNDWAKAHPEEIQQMYIMTSIHTAVEESLEIHLMDHLYPDMLAVNTRDDIRNGGRLWTAPQDSRFHAKNGLIMKRPEMSGFRQFLFISIP